MSAFGTSDVIRAHLLGKQGADVQTVAKGMGLDKRIGGKVLHAGAGFGGSCFPKDVAALVHIGDERGCRMDIARVAETVNQRQRDPMVEKVRAELVPLNNKTVAMLGLSFKPNTGDLRESPAMAIAERLLAEGCTLQVYDPAAMEEAMRCFPAWFPAATLIMRRSRRMPLFSPLNGTSSGIWTWRT